MRESLCPWNSSAPSAIGRTGIREPGNWSCENSARSPSLLIPASHPQQNGCPKLPSAEVPKLLCICLAYCNWPAQATIIWVPARPLRGELAPNDWRTCTIGLALYGRTAEPHLRCIGRSYTNGMPYTDIRRCDWMPYRDITWCDCEFPRKKRLRRSVTWQLHQQL